MPSAGRDKAVTAEQIFEMIKSSDRPAWSAKDVGDYYDVSTPTAKDRLKELDEQDWVTTVQISNVTAYYIQESDDLDLVDHHKQSLVDEFTDKFVGLETEPWTAVHPNDGPAEAGDKVQIRVEGVPGEWRQQKTHTWDSRREELFYEETSDDETQALISGELYAKPTTPIEHTDYPDDYDLELNIGAQYQEVEGRSQPILIAAGVKNYLIKPCNDAVFLKNVSVDWMSPKGHGQELETYSLAPDEGFVEQMLESTPNDEVGKGWLKNMIAMGAIGLDAETVEWLVNHENSPIDSKEELRQLAEEAKEMRDEEVDEDDLDDTEVI